MLNFIHLNAKAYLTNHKPRYNNQLTNHRPGYNTWYITPHDTCRVEVACHNYWGRFTWLL